MNEEIVKMAWAVILDGVQRGIITNPEQTAKDLVAAYNQLKGAIPSSAPAESDADSVRAARRYQRLADRALKEL